jgi:hypothetical protein
LSFSGGLQEISNNISAPIDIVLKSFRIISNVFYRKGAKVQPDNNPFFSAQIWQSSNTYQPTFLCALVVNFLLYELALVITNKGK